MSDQHISIVIMCQNNLTLYREKVGISIVCLTIIIIEYLDYYYNT